MNTKHKTKGINAPEHLENFKPTNENERLEISLKGMINSCYTYGGHNKDSHNYKQYILPYKEKLGSEVFEDVYTEQVNFLEQNCEIKSNVYTDSEGLSYNSLVVKEQTNEKNPIDLFHYMDYLPNELQNIIQEYESELDYNQCEEFLHKVNSVGYTFEYGLDAIPCNLRKL